MGVQVEPEYAVFGFFNPRFPACCVAEAGSGLRVAEATDFTAATFSIFGAD